MRHASLHRLDLERLRDDIDAKLVDLIEAECLEYMADLSPSGSASLLDALAQRLRTRADVAAADARAGIDIREE